MNLHRLAANARPPRLATACVLLLTVAGCATAPATTTPRTTGEVVTPPAAASPAKPAPAVQPPLLPEPEPKAPVAVEYPKTLAAAGAAAPVLALARQAQQSRAAGQHEAALGQWQRALRIEPRNAFLWHEIAITHLSLQHAGQAESSAQKSTSLARGNLWLEAENWRLIASARRLLLDTTGAEAAMARAASLSPGIAASAP